MCISTGNACGTKVVKRTEEGDLNHTHITSTRITENCIVVSKFTSVLSYMAQQWKMWYHTKDFSSRKNDWSFLCLATLHKKMKFSIKDFFSKCEQIRSFLRIRSHLLNKYLVENFIFCAVQDRKAPIKLHARTISTKSV